MMWPDDHDAQHRSRTSRARTSRPCASESENGSNHFMIEPVISITTIAAPMNTAFSF